MELEDLYDKNFNKLGKTIRRRIDDIPEGCYIMMSYVLIKNNHVLNDNDIKKDKIIKFKIYNKGKKRKKKKK